MQSKSGFDSYALIFDQHGNLTDGNEFQALRYAITGSATDVIFIAHGFRSGVNDAATLYNTFLAAFQDHLPRPEFQEIARRKYVVAAVYWPSKALPESFPVGAKLKILKELVPSKATFVDQATALLPLVKNDSRAQDKFASLTLSILEGSTLDTAEGLPLLRQQKGSNVLPKLGGVDEFLNLLVWYVMENRAGVVGAAGVAQAVRDARAANPSIKIHLVGHSLGGRLMAACAKSLSQAPLLQPDSMLLLQAAFSQCGFSAKNGNGKPGFFRDVIAKQVISGPLVGTFSKQDTVVGSSYETMNAIIADENFGALGRSGAQKTTESAFQLLKPASTLTSPYIFRSGVVNCLDGSGGLIKDHGDITNPDVTYAFASAVASTRSGEVISASA